MLDIVILQRKDLERCGNLLFWFRNVFYMKNPKLCPSAISLQLWHLVKDSANETILLVSLHIDKNFLFTVAEPCQRQILLIWCYFQHPLTHQMSRSTTYKVFGGGGGRKLHLVSSQTTYASSNFTISKHILVAS